MDAQNAVEPASTKPAASPKRPGSDAEQQKSSAPAVTKLSSIAKPDLPPKDSSNRPSALGSGSGSGSHATPADDDVTAADGNSDAETIVLPGKDGHSPSKVRKIIKHEEKSDGEDIHPPPAPSLPSRKQSNVKQDRQERLDRDGGADRIDRGDRSGDKAAAAARSASSTRNGPIANAPPNESGAPSLASKKKKQHLDTKAKIKDGSNGLSSAPASPPQRRRRSSIAQQSKSDSETGPVDSPKSSVKDKDRPLNKAGDKSDKGDKSVPHKRKAPRPDSDDEAENRKIRRQRISGSGLDASRKQQQQQQQQQQQLHQTAKPHHEAHSATRTRSASPLPRPHRRSASTQLPGHSSNGLSQKKKRVPAPLQSTDYPSDESSASGSPHPRSSKLRSLATPATAESTISPAKMVPHKKHLDAHGQTFLARACAKGEYDTAKTRLQERPEDINVADYAGNTPLQIAALNGYDDIVKLLVDAGCNLDCVNNDKDTPLLDAVENGHLEVVNILLDAGVNPRKANAYGQEPIARVNDDLDHADDIRQALINAKKKMGERRRTSEEHQPDHNDAVSSRGLGSPRRSPGVSSSVHGGGGRRAGTVRATKTSNHLLYMPMDDKTLREAAARGDEETVTRILQVREAFDDPESMVAAARGGHEMVMQLLLALGKANPDPSPIATPDGNTEYATPILAAIGQENIKIIRLLLDQADFDPTKRYKGETYFEIARRRQGANWIEEEQMLKDAYDEYKKSHKDISKNRSPSRREQDKESRRNRAEPKDEVARSHKRKASSPSREPKKSTVTKVAVSPRGEKRRSDSFTTHQDDQTSPKRGPGRPKKDDRSIPLIAISDREASPAAKPISKAKRAESDLAAVSSEGENVKPRRKLISARELKDKREKQQQRRASLTSNASSVMKEPSSPREEPDKTPKMEKYHDRTKALKRDESRDRLSVSGDAAGKRHRASATPPIGPLEKEAGEGPIKRRRLEGESKERRLKPSQSDDRLLKAPASREGGSSPAAPSRMSSKTRENEDRRPTPKPRKMEGQTEHVRRESPSVPVKSEDQDVEMLDVDQPGIDAVESRALQQRKKEEHEKKKQAEAEAAAREHKKKEDERKRKEEEEREKERLRAEDIKRHAEAEARRRAEEEQRRKEEEESKRKEEDEQRKKREDEQRKQKELEERRRAEEERKRQEDEERKLREEAERKQREEEERLHREQVEREAAEEARRKEEERKEHAAREEERRRAAREAEARRLREQEERRQARLPPLLRWLETAVNPKVPEVAEKFSTIQGVRFDCIRPEANGTAEGREQWLLNTQVALLLGEKDLELSRYTAWARVPASLTAKEAIWRLEADRYALTTSSLYELGKQIPDYYPDNEPEHMSYPVRERLRSDAWEKFSALDMFFVKASDLMFIVSTTHHLQDLKLTMAYCELPEPGAPPMSWLYQPKWKNDPPQAHTRCGFAPGNKYFIRGELVSEDKPALRQASTSPFPRHRFVRHGFVAVSQEDTAHDSVRCKEQDGDESMIDSDLPLLPNGVHSSPASTSSHLIGPGTANGMRSPTLVTPTVSTSVVTTNGFVNLQPISPSSEPGPAQARPLANGIHSVANGDAL